MDDSTENRKPRGDFGHGGDRARNDFGMQNERPRSAPMEVLVDGSVEKAMKVLKRKLIKEGLFKELKARKFFEKPSEKRKRKTKEAIKKIKKDARAKRPSLV